jgi:hypothetical protein
MENQQVNEIEMGAKQEAGWEREVLEKVALAAVTEQTRARRWSIFFQVTGVFVSVRHISHVHVSEPQTGYGR